jgi:hypothetical protein
LSHSTLAAQLAEYEFDGTVSSEDRALADAAQRWMEDHGWEFHYIHGWSDGTVSVFPDGEDGLIFRSRNNRFWPAQGEAHVVRSFKQALNIMVEVLNLPKRFSTHGRDALRDYAEAADRAAARLEEGAEDLPRGLHYTQDRLVLQERARGTRIAAEVARGHSSIAVLS